MRPNHSADERSLLELAEILTDEQAVALETAIEERRERRGAELERQWSGSFDSSEGG